MAVEFHDRTLNCETCRSDFVFTVGEQQFFTDKGFVHPPKRCKFCRMRNRVNGQKLGPIFTEITCSECGKRDVIPFQPKGDRPIFCRECFNKRQSKVSPVMANARTSDRRNNVNPETIYTHFTEGQFFSPERHVTKDVLQSITRKAKWGTDDFKRLQNIQVVAPNDTDLSTVLSNDGPVCFLSPGIEHVERETAEFAIIGSLARAVAMGSTGKNQIEGETRRLLNAWNYAAAAGRREAGVGA